MRPSTALGYFRMAKRTPLYDRHLAIGAKMVDFGGWDMPLHYGSQLQEHHQVRKAAGLFDVSHMTIVDFPDPVLTCIFLRHLLANDVARLYPGKALYTCLLNEAGGVIDDLIVYDRGERGYRLVLNAATRDKDLAWIAPIAADFNVTWQERDDLAMLAVQPIPPPFAPAHVFTPWKATVCSSPAPATPARRAWKSCHRWVKRQRYGIGCWRPVSPPVDWALAIPCVWKPG